MPVVRREDDCWKVVKKGLALRLKRSVCSPCRRRAIEGTSNDQGSRTLEEKAEADFRGVDIRAIVREKK